MKKIYLFYLYDSHDKMTEDIYPAIVGLNLVKEANHTHVLYAWTPNKNIRARFKESRNMKKFKEVVCEIDSEDIDQFSDENSDTFLEDRAVTTKKISEDGIITKKNVYILSTKKELDVLIYDELSISRKYFECLINTEIYLKEEFFISKYRDVLEFFHLNDIMCYAYPIDEDDIPFNTLTTDALSVYSHLYVNTYRKGY